MTLLAGIYSRDEAQAIPDSFRDSLVRAISRHPEDEARVFQDARCCLVKVDIGAHGETAFRADGDGAVSLLAGEPLLKMGDADDARWQSRTVDLDLLHESWVKEDWNPLRRARGVFCAAHYERASGRLLLIADKLCIRPLYYWTSEKYVVFATALRIFESLAEIPKQMDVRAVTEMINLGIPLGTRTPYAGIALLRAAEIVEIRGTKISRQQYWRWDGRSVSHAPEAELLGAAHARFTNATNRRARTDTTTAAFLSGGLDSRCVVAALAARGLRTYSFNFSPPRSLDQVLGAEFARTVGTIHHEEPMGAGSPNWSQMMADAWRRTTWRNAAYAAERPALVWSGDGGSVGMGHVYINGRMVEQLRAGETGAAIAEFLRQEHAVVARRLLTRETYNALAQTLQTGIREELDDIECEDRGRAFFLFLLVNDQRRHLAQHFENIDLHRLEFQLPFLDSDFLELIVAIPFDLCLFHRFYNKWLALFAPTVTSVAWQAYPGHEPCPLPLPDEELDYQWDGATAGARRALRKQETLEQAGELLRAADFPAGILDKGYLRLVTWLYRAGVRDYSYVIETARVYHQYWSLCGGSYTLPRAEASEQPQ